MTTELMMLVYTTALLIVLVLAQTLAGIMAQGLMPLAGPRDELPPPGKFQLRMKRVVDNHREGLLMFAPLVLVAAVAGVTSPWTELGAQIYFFARLVHAALYVSGAPLVRPLAWGAGLAGLGMILLALLGWI